MKENSFESKLVELEKIVKSLEAGDIELEDAIDAYSKAMKLAQECGEKLNNATEAVNKILTETGKLEDFTIKEDNQ